MASIPIRSGVAARRLLPSLSHSSRFAPWSALTRHQSSRLGSFPEQWSFRRIKATSAASPARVPVHHDYEEEEITHAPMPDSNRAPVSNSGALQFDLRGGVYIVTGGARGLGLRLAEALAEAGGKVYCLDMLPVPDASWLSASRRILHKYDQYGGSLHYRQVDVTDQPALDKIVARIAEDRQRLDGLIAAAGKQMAMSATDHTINDVQWLMNINHAGVFMSASAAARQMLRFKTRGSICLIASMSGMAANKGLVCPIYNSSKAAVIQLARNLAMEWGRVREDGSGGIRVNCLSPGHILTPMVREDFARQPGLQELWEKENMLGRMSNPEEFKGAALFLLSTASSFMTGSNLVMDGGHTAW